MPYGYCYDEEGRFTEMVRAEEIINTETGEVVLSLPPQCTFKQPPDGEYYPRFMGARWVTREEYTLDKKETPTIPPEEEITHEFPTEPTK